MLVTLAYLATAVYYFYVRATRTLNLEWMWYAYFVLVVEIMWGVSNVAHVVIFARKLSRKTHDRAVADKHYVVRMIVPCSTESLETVQRAVASAMESELPVGCTRHVYLCDDGCDHAKEIWCEGLGRSWTEGKLHYWRRPRGEIELNSKACTLNFALKRVYGTSGAGHSGAVNSEGAVSEGDLRQANPDPIEVVVVLDADVVCKTELLTRTLPILDRCDAVLTPNGYSTPSVNGFVTHSNLHLSECTLLAAKGLCCLGGSGTSLVIRGETIVDVGYFPEDTFPDCLSFPLELWRSGYNVRYLDEYLGHSSSTGSVENIFKQRERG